MIDRHPSEIPGTTEEYRSFIDTWARYCGAPRGVFVGQLNVVVQAEVRMLREAILGALYDLDHRDEIGARQRLQEFTQEE